MRKSRRKNVFSICFFLLMGLLLQGCGKTETEKDGTVMEESLSESGSVGDGQTESGGDDDSESRTLSAGYRSLSMDRELLGTQNQLLDLRCLAVENMVYAGGIRLNQDKIETAVYRIEREEEPVQVLSLPEETLIAWCRTQDGIALLNGKVDITENAVRKRFVLHTFQGEELEASGEWILTDAFEEAEIENVSFGSAMALEGEELILSEKIGKNLYVVDLSAGEVTRTITTENSVEELQYEDQDTVLGISLKGEIYAIHPRTGGIETKTQALFAQYGSMQHWKIGQDQVFGGAAQGLYAAFGGSEKKILDYEYGLEPQSSLWMAEDGSQGILAGWNQESRRLGIYTFSDTEEETADHREVITMSGFGVDEEYRRAAAEFNQNSDRYRVEVLEEESGIGIEDMAARMETQLMSGKGADLLVVSTWSWFRDYAENGYLEDLMPYISRDLNPEDYVQSALYAYKKGDAVYAMESSFALALLAVDSGVAKGASDWTMADFYRLAEASGIPAVEKSHDSQEALAQCLKWLGENVYDTEQIRQCVLFAEAYGNAPSERSQSMKEGKLGEDYMIESVQISNPLALADILQYYGENAVLMGYPGMQGGRIVHANTGAVSINKSSEKKEGAWAFIRFMLGREYQFTMEEAGFPLWKEAYEARLDYYQKPKTYDVYLPEVGSIITVENSHTLPRSMSETEAMTEEQIRILCELVEESRVDIWEAETEAVSIILEEAESYYNGNKGIDQMLEVVESRLEIYQGE